MTQGMDPLFYWRLADEMSVAHAAVLMTGNNPDGWLNYERFDGYTPCLIALTGAIRSGAIPAQLVYHANKWKNADGTEDNFLFVSKREIAPLLSESCRDLLTGLGSADLISVEREPDWDKSTVKADDIRAWLRSKGACDGFFVNMDDPPQSAEAEDFMDPNHERFAPELALAVAAWRGVLNQRKIKTGTKAALEAWIKANTKAWQGGGDEPSPTAIERITTVANWRRTGGAPTSNGE